jgi:hypothetical protein
MKRLISIILALVVVAIFAFGCAGISRDAKVKCPKCGAIFAVDEGLNEYEMFNVIPHPRTN